MSSSEILEVLNEGRKVSVQEKCSLGLVNPLKGEALVEFKKKLLAFHQKKEEDYKRIYVENSREIEENKG